VFNLEYLQEIREYELALVRTFLPKSARILEIGAGTGQQAQLLASYGYDVVALDMADSNYAGSRIFPVADYDGKNIPFPDANFDVVFSSNVLEHIDDLGPLLRECNRVLKPDGIHVHAMPTPAWRFWTNMTGICDLPQTLFASLRDCIPRSMTYRDLRRLVFFPIRALLIVWDRIVPKPHGSHGSAFSELISFRSDAWRKRLSRHEVITVEEYSMGLFYTGNMLLGPNLSLAQRENLAKILGPACRLFLCRPKR
jgi:SAM-dependent methyltransferase